MSNACNVGSPLCFSIADCEVKTMCFQTDTLSVMLELI